MPREPLFPHIPRRQEPQFPHKGVDDISLIPAVRRVRILAWRPPPPPKLAELKERLAGRIGRRGRGHDILYDEQAYIVARRVQGLTAREIAEELGRGEAAIYAALREAGIPAPIKELPVAAGEIREGKDRRETMVQMRQAGFTLEQIGSRFGITRGAARWHLYRAGEKIDLGEFAISVRNTFYKVADALRGPATISRMEQAADALRNLIRDITNVEQLLRPGEMSLIRRPLEIRRLAELARTVLLTGIWCLRTVSEGVWTVEWRVSAEEVRQATKPIPAEALKRLRECPIAAALVARFIIEEVPGYVERSIDILDLIAELEEL